MSHAAAARSPRGRGGQGGSPESPSCPAGGHSVHTVCRVWLGFLVAGTRCLGRLLPLMPWVRVTHTLPPSEAKQSIAFAWVLTCSSVSMLLGGNRLSVKKLYTQAWVFFVKILTFRTGGKVTQAEKACAIGEGRHTATPWKAAGAVSGASMAALYG